MAIDMAAITLDCADPRALAEFWTRALGTTVLVDYDGFYLRLAPAAPGAMALALQAVPEPKQGKNRAHIDFGAVDRLAEVERLKGLGATFVDEHTLHHPAGDFTWTVLADPEGNEFCVADAEG